MKKKFIFRFFGLFSAVLFFISCANPQPPKWLINPPKDNSLYFYAAGEGYTKKEAVKSALNDIASRINVKITSEFVVNKGSYNNKIYNDTYRLIKAEVKNIKLNYEILKTKKIDKKIYVLLKVDKEKLITSLKSDINNEIKRLSSLLKTENPCKKVKNAYIVLQKLKSLNSKISILNYFIPSVYDTKKLFNTALKLKSTPFKIKANYFKNENLNLLSEFFNITNSAENLITINTSYKKLKLFDYYLIKGNSQIKLCNQIIEFNFLGKSYSNYNNALENAKINFIKNEKKALRKYFNSF
jgi:hypothetical protein